MSRKECPRCHQVRLLGPWRSDAAWPELCGGCKIDLTMARPGARDRLAAAVTAAMKVKP